MLTQETCPREWISSDDFAERFCAQIQMCRRIAAKGELAESVCLIATSYIKNSGVGRGNRSPVTD